MRGAASEPLSTGLLLPPSQCPQLRSAGTHTADLRERLAAANAEVRWACACCNGTSCQCKVSLAAACRAHDTCASCWFQPLLCPVLAMQAMRVREAGEATAQRLRAAQCELEQRRQEVGAWGACWGGWVRHTHANGLLRRRCTWLCTVHTARCMCRSRALPSPACWAAHNSSHDMHRVHPCCSGWQRLSALRPLCAGRGLPRPGQVG